MINTKDNAGDTPLHIAARFDDLDHARIVLLLLSNGAIPDIPNNAGETPDYLIRRTREESDNPDVVLALQQAIEFINVRNDVKSMLESFEG